MWLEVFNTVMSLTLAIVLGMAIVSTRVRDGIVIKTGLMFMTFGFFGAAMTILSDDPNDALAMGHAAVHIGLLICVLGYLLRTRRKKGEQRRISDWADLTRTPEP